jgi:predicted RNase H-like HicB family nuclease
MDTRVKPAYDERRLGAGKTHFLCDGAQAGSLTEVTMAHYIAIIEDAGPDHAVGVWFPDLPGCTSAGDDIDEALRNAPEALELYVEALHQEGRPLPRARTLTELKADPDVAGDIGENMVALIELRASAHAAE